MAEKTSNIVKLSGSKAKKEPVPLSIRIAAIANAHARKEKEWRLYSDAQDKRRDAAEGAEDEISKARSVWQATINKRIKPEGHCEVTSLHVDSKGRLAIKANCYRYMNGKYPSVMVIFTFGFATNEEFDHQIGTLKGILIAASRGQG